MTTQVAVANDPHHGGGSQWKLSGGRYYHRSSQVAKWVEVKRLHPTPARIEALAWLIDDAVGPLEHTVIAVLATPEHLQPALKAWQDCGWFNYSTHWESIEGGTCAWVYFRRPKIHARKD